MKKKIIIFLTAILSVLSTLSGATLHAEEGEVAASYLYNLSNFTGNFSASYARVKIDDSKDEVYVLAGNYVTIFNVNGMEVYSFNNEYELGAIIDFVIDKKTGDIIVLSSRDGKTGLIRCNFRGEQISTIELKNIPPELSGIRLNRFVYSGDSFYLAAIYDAKIIVTDDGGNFRKVYDLSSLVSKELDEKEKQKASDDLEMGSFSVDRQGNILAAVPSMGKVIKILSDTGEVRMFGRRGSNPGKFGIPMDVVADASGKYLFVVDILRCVVMIFDNDFKFYKEFGQRGLKPGNLIGPMYLAVDGKNRIYVSQIRNRGVSVYQFTAP